MEGVDGSEKIYYQLSDDQRLIGSVDRIELLKIEFATKDVGDLRDAIMKRAKLDYRPQDLSIYPKGTGVAEYQGQQALEIDLHLTDNHSCQTSIQKPLLVVIAPIELS